jgi:hypothetical protein
MIMTPRERAVRDYAGHMAMTVRRRGNKLTLWEGYGEKRMLGTYRSFKAVERAITKYSAKELRASKKRQWMKL